MNETELLVDASELKSKEGSETLEALAKFLEEKTGGTVKITESEMRLENVNVKKSSLRVFIRKFLHKEKLKNYFRVIIDAEKLIVKEKKSSYLE
jgi:hypothetical protein